MLNQKFVCVPVCVCARVCACVCVCLFVHVYVRHQVINNFDLVKSSSVVLCTQLNTVQYLCFDPFVLYRFSHSQIKWPATHFNSLLNV